MTKQNQLNQQLVGLARKSCSAYARLVYPGFTLGKFHKYLFRQLDAARRREQGHLRIAISVPPQHGKSTAIAQIWPSHCFGNASLEGRRERITLVSYAASLASEHGIQARTLMSSKQHALIFPDGHLLADTRTGGAIRGGFGTFRPIGLDGSITGYPSDIMIVDDPIKNRQQADSPTYQKKLHAAFGPNMYTRLQKNSPLIILHTRWNEQDLIGFVRREYSDDDWLTIRLPALCDSDADPLGRSIGQPLFPERYDLQDLLKIKANQNVRDWHALYQQDPLIGGGSFWQPEYARIALQPAKHEFQLIFAAWDCASELHVAADWSACTIWGLHIESNEAKLWNLGCERWRVDINGLVKLMQSVNDEFGLSFTIVEKASNGIAAKQLLDKQRPDMTLHFRSAHANKGMEFALASNAMKERLVWFADLDYWGDMSLLLAELANWPGYINDDCALSAMHAIRYFQEHKEQLLYMPSRLEKPNERDRIYGTKRKGKRYKQFGRIA